MLNSAMNRQALFEKEEALCLPSFHCYCVIGTIAQMYVPLLTCSTLVTFSESYEARMAIGATLPFFLAFSSSVYFLATDKCDVICKEKKFLHENCHGDICALPQLCLDLGVLP